MRRTRNRDWKKSEYLLGFAPISAVTRVFDALWARPGMTEFLRDRRGLARCDDLIRRFAGEFAMWSNFAV